MNMISYLATIVVVVVLAAAVVTAQIPPGFHVRVKPNSNYMKPYRGPRPPEPVQLEDKVHRCWGYLGRPTPISELKGFFSRGTLPTLNTCQGVINVHPHCFPHMFNIWEFARPAQRIYKLRRHCRSVIARKAVIH